MGILKLREKNSCLRLPPPPKHMVVSNKHVEVFHSNILFIYLKAIKGITWNPYIFIPPHTHTTKSENYENYIKYKPCHVQLAEVSIMP